MDEPPGSAITPELEARLAMGINAHPMLPPNTVADETGLAVYDPSMQLPESDDGRGILQFLGLSEAMIDYTMERWSRKHSASPSRNARGSSSRGSSSRVSKKIKPGTGSKHRSSLTDELLALYLARDASEPAAGSPVTYDSYINGGLSQGLRPEFAVFCGVIEINHQFQGNTGQEQFYRHFHAKSYREDADQIVRKNATLLKRLWQQKKAFEEAGGKAGEWT